MNTEEQATRIAGLETQIDLLQNEIFELRKGKDSQKAISDLMAQVAALKKIAKCERAQRLRDLADYETDDTMMPDFYEDARRMLVADRLLQTAKQMAKDTNAVRMRVATSVSNEVAQKTYESIGFREDTRFKNYTLELGD